MSFDPYELDRTGVRRPVTLAEYTARTFGWMVLGLLTTFAVAVGMWMTGTTWTLLVRFPSFQLVILVATLLLSVTMATRIESMAVGTAKLMFFAFAALFGVTLSTWLLIYDLTTVVLVLGMTAVYFGALAAYGHFTHRDLSGVGPVLRFGMIFLIVFGVLTLFFPFFSALDRLVSLVGMAVFLGCTAYDTQKIRALYHYYAGYPERMEKASIFSALQLYLDFLNLFLYLLRFMGRSRD